MDNNRPLTDREKWQQAERLLRDMSRECAKMNGDIHDLRADLAALREANRWIPVGERLPDDHCIVIGLWRDGLVEITRWSESSGWCCIGCTGWTQEQLGWINSPAPSHWRPMPAPPEPQAETEVPNV